MLAEGQKRARQAVVAFGISVLLGLVLLRAFGELWPGCRDVDFWRRYRFLRKAGAQGPLRVFTGSSRAACGIQPLAMDVGGLNFNFGVLGGNAVQDYYKLSWLVKLGRKPDLLVLEVWSVGYCLPPDADRWLADVSLAERRLYSRWAEDPRYYGGVISYVTTLPDDLDIPVRVFFPDWIPEHFRRNGRFDQRGSLSQEHPPSKILSPAQRQKVLEAARPIAQEFRPQSVHVAALRAQLELCRQQSIPVVLLKLPTGPSYRALYTAAHLRDSEALWRSLSQQYGALLLDHEQWGVEADFCEGCHLFDEAAVRYSRFLGQELRRLGY